MCLWIRDGRDAKAKRCMGEKVARTQKARKQKVRTLYRAFGFGDEAVSGNRGNAGKSPDSNHSFLLGAGDNRLVAINEALRAVRDNRELESKTVGVFGVVIKDQVLGEEKLEEAIQIIKKCKF